MRSALEGKGRLVGGVRGSVPPDPLPDLKSPSLQILPCEHMATAPGPDGAVAACLTVLKKNGTRGGKLRFGRDVTIGRWVTAYGPRARPCGHIDAPFDNRREDMDVRIQIPAISREHARLLVRGDKVSGCNGSGPSRPAAHTFPQVVVLNHSKLNPASVNRKQLGAGSERTLHDDDVIAVGPRFFLFNYCAFTRPFQSTWPQKS